MELRAVRVSQDNSQVVVITANRMVEIFDLGKGTRVSTRSFPGGKEVTAAAIAPDGRGFVLADADGTVSVFNADASIRIPALRGLKGRGPHRLRSITAHDPDRNRWRR